MTFFDGNNPYSDAFENPDTALANAVMWGDGMH
jgi:hypothetical protein